MYDILPYKYNFLAFLRNKLFETNYLYLTLRSKKGKPVLKSSYLFWV